MNNINDRKRISNAFKELRKRGWFARSNFWCCQSCGCAAVPNSFKNKFVFYHKQDAASFDKSGNLTGDGRQMYLSHGCGGNGFEVVAILNKHDLLADWDGNNDKRISINHKENV